MSKTISLRTVPSRKFDVGLHKIQPPLTEEQIKLLTELKLNNEQLYYLVYKIQQFGFERVYSELLKEIKGRDLILSGSEFDNARFQQVTEILFRKQKLESVKGLFGKCRKCGKDEVVYYEKQTRSGDEAMTYYITCVSCQTSWVQ